MVRKNKYLEEVINVLREKKELAYKEFLNSDLNKSEQLIGINIWFENVENIVKKNAPIFFVKNILIYEDELGKILKIDYEYYSWSEPPRTPTIRLITTLY